ncbi:hypothetical protein TruAng_010667 [Truncatella angustata]|nr:hypothetical protein TruAng_010667 [Truncatella angustata]
MGDHYMHLSPSHHTQDEFYNESTLHIRAQSTGPLTTAVVAPFSYSLSYDSSLPTPVSVVGSPSSSDKASIKMEHSFSNTGIDSQQPTPPGTARPTTSDWFNNNQNHSAIRTTQSSSPMNLNPSAGLLGMHGLGSTHSSAQTNIPASSGDYYFGSYGIPHPDPQDDMSPPIASSVLFPTTPHVNPSALLRSYPLPSNSHVPLAPAPQVPILGSTTYPGVHGTPITPIEGINHFGPLMIGIRKRPRGNIRRQLSRNNPEDFDENDEERSNDEFSPVRHVEQEQKSRPKLQLRPDPSKPEDMFVFNLREDLIQFKGKGMWDKIAEIYEQHYEKKNRAALQMQLSRAVARLAIWPEEEDRALLEAIAEYDKRRYSDLIKIMKEKGGCRYWEWKPEHIAKRLAELGEEEFDPETKPKTIRRRRKETQRQRTQQPNLWNQPSPPSAMYDGHGLSTETRINLTAEQEEQLFRNLFEPEPESPVPENTEISESTPPSRRVSTHQELNQAQSERVAKQACDKMIAKQQQQPPRQHDNMSYYNNQFAG